MVFPWSPTTYTSLSELKNAFPVKAMDTLLITEAIWPNLSSGGTHLVNHMNTCSPDHVAVKGVNMSSVLHEHATCR